MWAGRQALEGFAHGDAPGLIADAVPIERKACESQPYEANGGYNDSQDNGEKSEHTKVSSSEFRVSSSKN